MPAHRRDFLRSSLAASTLVSMGAATVPAFLSRSAVAAAGPGTPGGDRGPAGVRRLRGNHGRNRALPLAMPSKRTEVPTVASLDQYRLQIPGSDADRRAGRDALNGLARVDRKADDPLLGFVRRSTLSAYASSQRLEAVTRD